MELTVLALIAGAAAALFVWGRRSRDDAIAQLKAQLEAAAKHHSEVVQKLASQVKLVAERDATLESTASQLRAAEKRHAHAVGECRAEIRQLREAGIENIARLRTDNALLPSLVRWADQLREEFDRLREARAETDHASAPAAKERVRQATARARAAEKALDEIKNRLALYESQAPWLREYEELSLEEVLEGLRSDEAVSEALEAGTDPVKVFVSANEWATLSSVQVNQLALDRFLDRTRARSAWAAGIEYERFVGYFYEQSGWKVDYQGATKGKDDLGLDLICTRGAECHVVQCKRLSVQKGIPVRENVVGQLYGAARFHAFEAKRAPESVTPVLVTTFELSAMGRKFASSLGVVVQERHALIPYPRIKCNVSRRDGERIYHLPFDQQYDATKIDADAGERYAHTVAEAEAAGFRRAFRWRGN